MWHQSAQAQKHEVLFPGFSLTPDSRGVRTPGLQALKQLRVPAASRNTDVPKHQQRQLGNTRQEFRPKFMNEPTGSMAAFQRDSLWVVWGDARLLRDANALRKEIKGENRLQKAPSPQTTEKRRFRATIKTGC